MTGTIKGRNKAGCSKAQARTPVCPRLEELESRLVPAGFSLGGLDLSATYDPGTGFSLGAVYNGSDGSAGFSLSGSLPSLNWSYTGDGLGVSLNGGSLGATGYASYGDYGLAGSLYGGANLGGLVGTSDDGAGTFGMLNWNWGGSVTANLDQVTATAGYGVSGQDTLGLGYSQSSGWSGAVTSQSSIDPWASLSGQLGDTNFDLSGQASLPTPNWHVGYDDGQVRGGASLGASLSGSLSGYGDGWGGQSSASLGQNWDANASYGNGDYDVGGSFSNNASLGANAWDSNGSLDWGAQSNLNASGSLGGTLDSSGVPDSATGQGTWDSSVSSDYNSW